MRASVSLLPVMLLSALLVSGCGKKSDADLAAHDCTKGSKQETSLGMTYEVDRGCAGDPVPSGQFDEPGGKKTTLASFAGKPLLVTVWAHQNDASVQQLDVISRISKDISHQGKFTVIAINDATIDTDQANVDAGMTGVTSYKDLRAKDAGLIAALHAKKLPVTMLYDAQGKLVWQTVGENLLAGDEGEKLLAEAK